MKGADWHRDPLGSRADETEGSGLQKPELSGQKPEVRN
jgi:hypothetical protein